MMCTGCWQHTPLHGAKRWEAMTSTSAYSVRTAFHTWNFAIVICRNKRGKYLAVLETGGRGWWVPGGRMQPGESFLQTAVRETKEETGIDVTIRGVLRVEHTPRGNNHARMRVIFFAEPVNEQQQPKQEADHKSQEARWVTIDEFVALGRQRGPELVQWGRYLSRGGTVYSSQVLGDENEAVRDPAEGGSRVLCNQGCFHCLQYLCCAASEK